MRSGRCRLPSRTVRSAVYNRYWSTGGGAETYGGAVAQLLARRGPVELLGHEAFDPVVLGERLALDLSGCTVRVVPYASAAVTAASRDADLFVNVSHRSRDASAAGRSLYVVHFPTSHGRAAVREPGTGLPHVAWGAGFHGSEGRTTWTDGDGTVLVTTVPGRPVDVTLLLGPARPAAAGPCLVRVLVDGVERARADVSGPRTPLERWSGRAVRVRVASPAEGVPAQVRLVSPSFVPGDLGLGDDTRTLGVPVVGVGLGRTGRLVRGGVPVGSSTAWLDSYDALVANAAFTRGWVERLWGRDSAVLHPPVALREAGPKERVVLAVGRFFPSGKGHSKKQRELVQAFRRLERPGWSLHLVGGCAPDGRDYLESVRAEAEGLDVVLHPNATGAELAALYARASVFWHAAGLGEDPERDPDRLEHFGISTVEAMSAGAVPVVLRAGGLVESVRDGVDGRHVDDLDGFVSATRALVDDAVALAGMASNAQERAREFSLEAFDVRLQALLDRL